jgi:hypothetical protein
LTTTTTNNNNNNDKKKRRSRFAEAADLEKKLAAARKKVQREKENSLTAQNADDELARRLLAKALRESLSAMFAKTDRLQGGSFIYGSMANIDNKWRKLV